MDPVATVKPTEVGLTRVPPSVALSPVEPSGTVTVTVDDGMSGALGSNSSVVGRTCRHVPATAGERVGTVFPRETADEKVKVMVLSDATLVAPSAGAEEARENDLAVGVPLPPAVVPSEPLPPVALGWPPDEPFVARA